MEALGELYSSTAFFHHHIKCALGMLMLGRLGGAAKGPLATINSGDNKLASAMAFAPIISTA